MNVRAEDLLGELSQYDLKITRKKIQKKNPLVKLFN